MYLSRHVLPRMFRAVFLFCLPCVLCDIVLGEVAILFCSHRYRARSARRLHRHIPRYMYHVRIRICYNKYQWPQMRRRLQPLQTWPPRGCAPAVPMQTPHSIAPLTLLVLDKPKSHHGIFSTMPVTRRKSSRK